MGTSSLLVLCGLVMAISIFSQPSSRTLSFKAFGEIKQEQSKSLMSPSPNATTRKVEPYSPSSNEHICTSNDCVHAEAVGLFDWEIQSRNTQECIPPKGMPSHCCLGSKSAGGNVRWKSHECNIDAHGYQTAQDDALEYLGEYGAVADDSTGTTRCDVCRIVELLALDGLTLSLHGDSITRQTFAGLECELIRRGYDVTVNDTPNRVPRPNNASWVYGFDATLQEMTVTMPDGGGVAKISHFPVYRPFPRGSLETEYLVKNSDIVVFDHGTHYNVQDQKSVFFKEMELFLERLARLGDLKLLAWRETSSQHFQNYGGHYPGPRKSGQNSTTKCVPMVGGEIEKGTYTNIMEMASATAGLTMQNALSNDFRDTPVQDDELVMLPFRRYTTGLHDLHDREDCTHYCHTPYLWLPLWRSLRIAMDRAL